MILRFVVPGMCYFHNSNFTIAPIGLSCFNCHYNTDVKEKWGILEMGRFFEEKNGESVKERVESETNTKGVCGKIYDNLIFT